MGDLCLPCRKPDICLSKRLCDNIKTTSCCWHEDIRDNKNIIYLDKYGSIDLSIYNLSIPPDIYYCPSCKITEESSFDIINNILRILPKKFRELEIDEKEREIRNIEELIIIENLKIRNKKNKELIRAMKQELHRKKINLKNSYLKDD